MKTSDLKKYQVIAFCLFSSIMSSCKNDTATEPDTYLDITDSSNGTPVLQVVVTSSEGLTVQSGDSEALYAYHVIHNGVNKYDALLSVDQMGGYYIRVLSQNEIQLKDSSELWDITPISNKGNGNLFMYEVKRKKRGVSP